MCGIVGALSFNNSSFSVSEKYIVKMRDTMAHRGPDGEGTWVSKDGRVALGHRRLSIIDLSDSASQPMCNEDRTLWVTYNGEIYNHAEIREELEERGGHIWKTNHSDTEVIIHAFEEWGIECLKKFRGMFAIALWDARNKELWLIRDRVGIKPLYYSIHHGRIVFASEIKALLGDPDQSRAVNEKALFHYLSFLTSPAPQTLFEGVKKLPAGCWLRINDNGLVREERYWDVLDNSITLVEKDEDSIAQMILQELKLSVRYRKVSDVPVGIFLSGGIDSSTNAALFSEGEDRPIQTFCIGYKGDYKTYQNETHYAQLMARQIGAEYHELLLGIDDLINFVPKMISLQDEPIADPVCVPVYYVSKLARENGVIVCQVGEGADELFWGYQGWKTSLYCQDLSDRFPLSFMKKIGAAALSVSPGYRISFHREWLRRAGEKQPIFWGGAEAFSEYHKKKILSHRLHRQFRNYSSWEALNPIRERFCMKAREPSNLNWMSYLDLNLRLPELLLMRVDKMSMGVSLEGRVPFLDHKFAELAMSIPSALKTKDGILKYILKKSVRGTIPGELIDRKKQGFGVPIYEWFFDKLGFHMKKELDEFCDKTDYFNKREIGLLMQRGNGPQIWYLFNFVLWWKHYIEQSSIDLSS